VSLEKRKNPMRATAIVFARVEDQRFSKAAEGIRNGMYQTTITLQTEDEVRGVVKRGNDKEYGCTITATGAFCSCPDALYRGSICKHAVALALCVIRNPRRDLADQAQTQPPEQRPYNLKLGRVRPNFVSCP
jgi:uncharacterized Zn finger protein